METSIDRRRFLAASAAAASLAALPSSVGFAAHKRDFKKSLKFGMIQPDDKNASIEDRFRIAKEAGFESVEPDTIFSPKDVEKYKAASEKLGIPVDGIICSTHWSKPLSDPDPKIAQQTMKGMRVSMQNAKDLGGDMVLLVPAVVNPGVQYEDAWKRSVPLVKELAKEAEDMGLTIGIENVWNKFLLSPLEACDYIDEIDSPNVRFWFDVGNVVLFGYPQDWIRTLGKERICRIDVKDFHSNTKRFVPLLKGSVDWPEVMKAFDEIEFSGYMAAEVAGGNLKHLTEVVSEPMDKIIAM